MKVESFPRGLAVGTLSQDQSRLSLAEPDRTSYEYKTLLAGRDARAYYAGCRDAAGRGLFETVAEATQVR